MQNALSEMTKWTIVVSFAGIDAPVCRDVKQNLKVCANVTCSVIVSLNVMSHVHVHVLRVAKPLFLRFASRRDVGADKQAHRYQQMSRQ